MAGGLGRKENKGAYERELIKFMYGSRQRSIFARGRGHAMCARRGTAAGTSASANVARATCVSSARGSGARREEGLGHEGERMVHKATRMDEVEGEACKTKRVKG